MSENTSKNSSVFAALGPGKIFGAGFVAALLVFCTIGFFVLLAGGGDFEFGSDDDQVVFGNPTVDTGTAPTPSAHDAQPTGGQVAAVTSDDHVRGDLTAAKAVIVEFSDFDCPFCERFHNTMNQVLAEYGSDVAWAYRHFPLDSIHPSARTKAEASECVAALGGNDAFWAFTDRLFDSSQGPVAEADLASVAGSIGVDATAVQNCIDADEYAGNVQTHYQDAVQAGGRGTPFSMVISSDGTQIPISGALPFEQVKSILDPIVQ